MYVLINRMAADCQLAGRVISCHRSLDAMDRASSKHARAVKRHNGPNSYIPYGYMIITGKVSPGDLVYWTDGQSITADGYDLY